MLMEIRAARSGAMQRAAIGFAAAMLCFCVTAQPQQRDPMIGEAGEVAPPDVFLETMRLQYDLAALRYVVGQSAMSSSDPVALEIATAAPRHVFYQAQVLFRKTNQLSEEIADRRPLPLEEVNAQWRRASPRPVPEGREISTADVLALVTDIRDRLRAMLLLLRVNISITDSLEIDRSKQTEDVLMEMMKVSSQINSMIHGEFRMRDVYEQVLVAINYAGDLGAGYPSSANSAGSEKARDVYQRLVGCLPLLRNVGTALDVQTLDLRVRGTVPESLEPADAYDLTTALISDLAHMVQQVDAEPTALPLGEYRRPRFVQAEDVFELVGVLERQLNVLATPESDN